MNKIHRFKMNNQLIIIYIIRIDFYVFLYSEQLNKSFFTYKTIFYVLLSANKKYLFLHCKGKIRSFF